MTQVMAEHDLFRACEVIFGPEMDLSREFLEYLQLSGVKSAYRKRALETHPDRCAVLDAAAAEHQNGVLFHDVQQAYENLVNYLKAREQGIVLLNPTKISRPRPTRPAGKPPRRRPEFYRGNRQSGGNGPNNDRRQWQTADKAGPEQAAFWNLDELYQGPMPERRLLLGHFLYYSGIATWRTIVQALLWQRGQRPKIGEVSRRLGLLDDEAIATILRHRSHRHPFGEAARRLGLLDDEQVRLLMQTQKRLQRRFGEYFVAQKILTPAELNQLLRAFYRHNARRAATFTGR
ncbi:MAG: DnaJ domain-containing protein [Desulfurivibrio sp.]|nr:DnaJ domain-containing protein [Desulfurivibrio sp.]